MADSSIGTSVDLAQQQRDKQLQSNISRVEAQGAQDVAAAEQAGQQDIALARGFAESQPPFDQQPPQDQIGQLMSGAPWLFALTAVGGALSKASGLAMLEGLNGVSSGIISGDQEAYQRSWDRYSAEYQKWKDRSDRQMRIYAALSDAYRSSADGKMRALQAAHQMTNDAYNAKLLVDDPLAMLKLKSELELQHAQASKAMAEADRARTMSTGSSHVQALKAALYERGVKLPSSRGANIDQTLQGLIDKHPDWDDDQIADYVQKNGLELAARTSAIRTAAHISGQVGVGLEEVKTFGADVLDSARAVGRGSFVPINKLLNMTESNIQNPALRQLRIDINEMMNAYDVVAARGHTDVTKRAEARALLTSADSYETLQTAVSRFTKLTEQAQEAADRYISKEATRDTDSAGSGPKTVKFGDLPGG